MRLAITRQTWNRVTPVFPISRRDSRPPAALGQTGKAPQSGAAVSVVFLSFSRGSFANYGFLATDWPGSRANQHHVPEGRNHFSERRR